MHGNDIYLAENQLDQVKKEVINNKKESGDDINNMEIKREGGRVIILKHKGNLIGSGKLSQGRITNFVPKERRLKN